VGVIKLCKIAVGDPHVWYEPCRIASILPLLFGGVLVMAVNMVAIHKPHPAVFIALALTGSFAVFGI
jgi:hypothetical protein